MNAPVDEIVSTLARLDPAALGQLRVEFPDSASLLQEGFIAGNGSSSRSQLVRIKAAKRVLGVATAAYKRLLPVISARIRSARRIALAGQLVSLLAGASLMADAAAAFPLAVKVACGLLGMAAAILGLLAQWKLNPEGGGGNGLPSLHAKLIEGGVSVQALAIEISLIDRLDEEAVETLIARINAACHLLNVVRPYIEHS